MRAISWRAQLGFVAACYAAVLTLGTVLVTYRYLQYVRHPEDVAASGGMYAFGDLLLEFFIAGTLLLPTVLLVIVLSKSETAYTTYSKIVFGLSLTAPLAFGLLCIPAISSGPGALGFVCMYRLETSPFALVAMGLSRLKAPSRCSKRFTLSALLVEGLTLLGVAVMAAASILGAHR
jgi:hypothetical protein